MKDDLVDLTLHQVSRELRLSRNVVLELMRSGDLDGYDASPPGANRRRYRVTRKALESFKTNRSIAAQPRRIRRKPPQQVKEFF